MIRKILGGILIYSILLYLIVAIGPTYDFSGMQIDPPNSLNNTIIFLTFGGTFRLIYDLSRRIIKTLTIPINWLTFGLLHVAINIGMLYVYGYVVNMLNTNVTIIMGSILEVVMIAIVLRFLGLFIKHL